MKQFLLLLLLPGPRTRVPQPTSRMTRSQVPRDRDPSPSRRTPSQQSSDDSAPRRVSTPLAQPQTSSRSSEPSRAGVPPVAGTSDSTPLSDVDLDHRPNDRQEATPAPRVPRTLSFSNPRPGNFSYRRALNSILKQHLESDIASRFS